VPVALEDYTASVSKQSLKHHRPSAESVRRALADLTVSPEMVARLGRAIASGSGLFLHGAPGNGKTSIAERITAVFGTSIWIPRAISVWGEIIRVFDPSCHEELPLSKGEQLIDDEQLDHRWVRIRRPTIVVGGELTMDSLEITLNKDTGIAEAPLQIKSNCGTLVIDDFGRQRVSPQKLLNRWIVPLEERHDFLGLPSGRKIKVPFDQFIVFSTNLEPKDLVDEAFLRRIPYKIEIDGPTPDQFRDLFEQTCQQQGVNYDAESLDHLLAEHYSARGRPMRFCHPRDLVHQIGIFCRFRGLPPAVSRQAVDAAATDYFSAMGS
jgi:predicted ATPase with chaperone activity